MGALANHKRIKHQYKGLKKLQQNQFFGYYFSTTLSTKNKNTRRSYLWRVFW